MACYNMKYFKRAAKETTIHENCRLNSLTAISLYMVYCMYCTRGHDIRAQYLINVDINIDINIDIIVLDLIEN